MDAVLVNIYIEKMMNKVIELNKVLILQEAQIAYLEGLNADLHKKVDTLEKKTAKKKETEESF